MLGIAFRLFFRQQSEAELPMPVSKGKMWDFGPSPSQGTFLALGEHDMAS